MEIIHPILNAICCGGGDRVIKRMYGAAQSGCTAPANTNELQLRAILRVVGMAQHTVFEPLFSIHLKLTEPSNIYTSRSPICRFRAGTNPIGGGLLRCCPQCGRHYFFPRH